MRFLFSALASMKSLSRMSPSKTTGWRLCFVAGFAACTAAAFWYGRQGASHVDAMAPAASRMKKDDRIIGALPSGDYDRRLVARIYESIPITREELGEYLIARFGAERVEFLVNRRIIEKECAAKGIDVSDGEVEAQLDADIAAMGRLLTRDEFVNNILKRFNKTLYEWKEDVIRPKLALAKLCRSTVTVEEADVRRAYEAKFGPRVEVRVICFQADDRNVFKVYEEVKKSEEKFSHYARNQFISHFGAKGGAVPAIHKHFPDADLEKEAFTLKEGEVSKIITLKDNTHVVMKCDKVLPADTTRTYEEARIKLRDELFDQKLAQMIPTVFNDLRKKANPDILLKANDRAASTGPARNDSVVSLPPPLPIPPAK